MFLWGKQKTTSYIRFFYPRPSYSAFLELRGKGIGRRGGRNGRGEGDLRGKGRERGEGRMEEGEGGWREGEREGERSYFPVQLSVIPTTRHPRSFTPWPIFCATYLPCWSPPPRYSYHPECLLRLPTVKRALPLLRHPLSSLLSVLQSQKTPNYPDSTAPVPLSH